MRPSEIGILAQPRAVVFVALVCFTADHRIAEDASPDRVRQAIRGDTDIVFRGSVAAGFL